MHDNFFKATFEKPEYAADLISNALPEELLRNIDLSTLKLSPNSYVDENLKSQFADLVYNCKLKQKSEVLISILLEHKSQKPKYPHIQLLSYMLNIWKDDITNKRDLRIVIPIVIYHGRERWEYRPFKEYFKSLVPYMESFIPDFKFILEDLKRYSLKEVNRRYKYAEVKFFVNLVRNIFNLRRLFGELPDIFLYAGQIIKSEQQRFYIRIGLLYLFKQVPAEYRDTLLELISKTTEEGETMTKTIAEALIEEGEQRGRYVGWQEGELSGVVKSIIQMAKKTDFSVEKIADILEVDVDFVKQTLKKHGLLKE